MLGKPKKSSDSKDGKGRKRRLDFPECWGFAMQTTTLSRYLVHLQFEDFYIDRFQQIATAQANLILCICTGEKMAFGFDFMCQMFLPRLLRGRS
jgi:hypothetical protein